MRRRLQNTCRAFVVSLTLAVFLSAAALSQEATQTVPWAYKLQFENEWARVIRAHYEPREKIPPHAHTKWPCVYVYLNDAGPVIFRHNDWEHPDLTRPATKAGGCRVSPTSAVNEVHEVGNPIDTSSDFLRVEFKTDADAATPLRGKFHRETYSPGENFEKVQFENAQIRATRLACAKTCELPAGAQPALLVVLSPMRLKSSGRGEGLEPGRTKWVAAGKKETVENTGQTHAEFLRFDFKTKPVKGDGKEAQHAHPHD